MAFQQTQGITEELLEALESSDSVKRNDKKEIEDFIRKEHNKNNNNEKLLEDEIKRKN